MAQQNSNGWPEPAKARILGKRFPRVEGPDKVTGKAKYTYDVMLPGMLYGRIIRSRYASARINSPADVDESDAMKIPGVKAVYKFVKDGGMNVRWAGEEIAAVAATTPEIANDAARAIERKIKYQPNAFVVDTDKAKDPNAPRVRPDGPNLAPHGGGKPTEQGDVDAGFGGAAATIEGTYEVQTRLHCCLETHGHVCKWDGDQLTVWASTQNVTGMKGNFNAPARIICEHMGGGFGSKFGPGQEGLACAQLAKLANAPVKLMLTREEEQMMPYRGPGFRAHIKLAAAADGTLVASETRGTGLGGVAMNVNTPLSTAGYYIIQPKAYRVYGETILTNAAGTAALRAPGHPQADWCWESALDDLAAKLNMDPLELRKRNHDENDPVRKIRRAEWERGAELIGWDRRNKVPGEGTGALRRGIGMASAQWGPGGSKNTDVDILIGNDGSITPQCGTQDIGTGTRTLIAAIVAEELGLELKDVNVKIGDTNFPRGAASGGSVTAPCVASPSKMAAIDAKNKLLALAAKHPSLSTVPENLELVAPGRIQVKGTPSKGITLKQACQLLPPGGMVARGEYEPSLSHTRGQDPGVAGCAFAEVEVDTETGRVRVVKVVDVQDCGYIINRTQAESQCIGGIIQGVAQALLEYRIIDNLTGRILNPNLEEYKLTHSMETPEMVVELFESGTGKVVGIGEPCVIPIATAIGNAVFNAIGIRIPDAPITPEKVLKALAQRRGGVA